jgi:hypothetical protein
VICHFTPAAQRYKEDQAKLAKEEAEKKKRLEEQKARDAAIEEKRKELERLRAAEEAEEQRKITEKLEQLALKEAKVDKQNYFKLNFGFGLTSL